MKKLYALCAAVTDDPNEKEASFTWANSNGKICTSDYNSITYYVYSENGKEARAYLRFAMDIGIVPKSNRIYKISAIKTDIQVPDFSFSPTKNGIIVVDPKRIYFRDGPWSNKSRETINDFIDNKSRYCDLIFTPLST